MGDGIVHKGDEGCGGNGTPGSENKQNGRHPRVQRRLQKGFWHSWKLDRSLNIPNRGRGRGRGGVTNVPVGQDSKIRSSAYPNIDRSHEGYLSYTAYPGNESRRGVGTTFANRPGYGMAAIFRRCPTNCTRAVISARQRTSFEHLGLSESMGTLMGFMGKRLENWTTIRMAIKPNLEGIEELFASKETEEVPQKPVEDLTADDIFLQSHPGLAQVWEEAQDKYYLNLLDTALNKLPKDIRNQTDKTTTQQNRVNFDISLARKRYEFNQSIEQHRVDQTVLLSNIANDPWASSVFQTLAPMLETSLLSAPFCPVN
ncbi:hypothetical protein Bbelb_334130 [Branchiostoma belcheri]|nr:hypothetical protein Bbelb_334130 [Branchiostoma belcheri]